MTSFSRLLHLPLFLLFITSFTHVWSHQSSSSSPSSSLHPRSSPVSSSSSSVSAPSRAANRLSFMTHLHDYSEGLMDSANMLFLQAHSIVKSLQPTPAPAGVGKHDVDIPLNVILDTLKSGNVEKILASFEHGAEHMELDIAAEKELEHDITSIMNNYVEQVKDGVIVPVEDLKSKLDNALDAKWKSNQIQKSAVNNIRDFVNDVKKNDGESKIPFSKNVNQGFYNHIPKGSIEKLQHEANVAYDNKMNAAIKEEFDQIKDEAIAKGTAEGEAEAEHWLAEQKQAEQEAEAQAQAEASTPLQLNNGVSITRNADTTPEAAHDIEKSILEHGLDPWSTVDGRSSKQVNFKARFVNDLVDPVGDRCPSRCNHHGQCVMDLGSTAVSGSGGMNVHPYHCVCDEGYVGESCQIKIDYYLRWLLTEGAAPYPKCCKICAKQFEVPLKWDDIPSYENPFSHLSPKCQPHQHISVDSRWERELGEFKHHRVNSPECTQPLTDLRKADPLIALELATSLSNAQQILHSDVLQHVQAIATHGMHSEKTKHIALDQHVARLKASGDILTAAASTAARAAKKLRESFGISDLSLPTGKVDAARLIEDSRRMPQELPECCLFCELDPVKETFAPTPDPNSAAFQEEHAKSPLEESPLESQKRAYAIARKDRRHARLLGITPKADRECCVVCPYKFREVEDLLEADEMKKKAESSESAAVFLEMESGKPRRAKHTPEKCCQACPSQFLVTHAFPKDPFSDDRTTL